MRIWAISDLHLPGGQDKPMDVFGSHWRDHAARIAQSWSERVAAEDVVLMPGDFSWAMTLDEVRGDLAYLARLPGRAVLVKGNHDYWWSSVTQVRQALPSNAWALQHDACELGDGWVATGTRGWSLPGSEGFDAHDEKVYRREMIRLRLGLEAAARRAPAHIAVLLHYPPVLPGSDRSEVTDLLETFGVALCVYGHLHERGQHRLALRGLVRGVRYELVSCDALGFAPLLVAG